MLCEKCGQKEAHVKMMAIVNGKKKVMNLCESCATELQGQFNLKGGPQEQLFNLLNAIFGGDTTAKQLNRQDESLTDKDYTETFLKVIEKAKEAKDQLSAQIVGSEHLLLGLLQVHEGLAYYVLQRSGIREEDYFNALQKSLSSNYTVLEFQGQMYSPMCIRIFQQALKNAKAAGEEKCGTEFLLEAILAESNCIGRRMLLSLGVPLTRLIDNLREAMETGRISKKENEKEETYRPNMSNTPNLDNYARDITQMAYQGKLDPVIGRSMETNRVIQTLSRKTKNNPCLIGEPGVGKTAIVEGLAQKIVSGDVPDHMQNMRILSLDLAGMVAGTKYRGEFEERIKSVIAECEEHKDIVLFIDELHTIIGAGGAEGSLDAANIIKPALSRGTIQLIGATTIQEYRKHIEKDAALERRFQPITVEEPTEEESIAILKGLRAGYEKHHEVKISDEAIEACVSLSKRYLKDRFLPDKAIDLMDEAGAKIHLQDAKKPAIFKELEEQINDVENAREEALLALDSEKAKELSKQKKSLQGKLKRREEKYEAQKLQNQKTVTALDIQEIIADWTKIPVQTLKSTEKEKLRVLEDTLRKRVIAQDEAVTKVAKAVRRGRVGLKDPRRPIGSFLFLGPTGVGKTELSKALAEALFGTEQSLIRVDMSEYMEKHSVSKMVGSPPGYVGFEEGGQLSEKIRRNPYSVILFDEIEKAHPDVFNILLQVLDDGIITDSQGRTVDFKNTIIIMTSNMGAETIQNPKSLGFGAKSDAAKDYEKMKEQVLEIVKKTLKPEFVNRIDDMVVFKALQKEDMKQIVEMMLRELKTRVKKNLKLKLSFSEKAVDYLVEKGYDPKYGARPLRRAVQSYVEDALSDQLLEGKVSEGDSVSITVAENQLQFKKKS